MNYNRIKNLFDNEPALKILRLQSGPLALALFLKTFKRQNKINIPLNSLVTEMKFFLDEMVLEAKETFDQEPEHYINLWCGEKHRFLRKYYLLNNDEPVLELTPGSERALEWIQGFENRNFVGTESRLLAIFDGMRDIVEQTYQDPKERVEALKRKKCELDQEIKEIQATGFSAKNLNQTQIRERFFGLLENSRRLLSDFRQIEYNFKEIAQDLKEKMAQGSGTRGQILEDAMDAREYMEHQDQGRSFYTFWELLMSPSKQEELRDLTTKVIELEEVTTLIDERSDREFVKPLIRLKSNLLGASQKVLTSNHRISEQFKRLLYMNRSGEGKRVSQLVNNIVQLFAENKDILPHKKILLELEIRPLIKLPLERPLWLPKDETKFQQETATEAQVDLTKDDLKGLINENQIDMEKLKRNIRKLLIRNNSVGLRQITLNYPVTKGLGEIIGYLQLAADGSYSHIDNSQTEIVDYLHNKSRAQAIVPRCSYWQVKNNNQNLERTSDKHHE